MYSFSGKFYLFDGDDVEKVTIKKFDEFYDRGKRSFPEYAGQSIKIAIVTLRLYDRKPCKVLFSRGWILKVRKDGGLDRRHRKKLEELRNTSIPKPEFSSDKSIVNASEIFRQKRIFSKFFWNLTEKEESMLLDKLQL